MSENKSIVAYKFGGVLANNTVVEIIIDFDIHGIYTFENYKEAQTQFFPKDKNLWKAAYGIIEGYQTRVGWQDEGTTALACDGFYWDEITKGELNKIRFIANMDDKELRCALRKTNG